MSWFVVLILVALALSLGAPRRQTVGPGGEVRSTMRRRIGVRLGAWGSAMALVLVVTRVGDLPGPPSWSDLGALIFLAITTGFFLGLAASDLPLRRPRS
jgi:uncharacterized membrane protein YczE